MKKARLKIVLSSIIIILALLVLFTVWRRSRAEASDTAGRGERQRVVPVEVAEIIEGRLDRTRMFSGTLTASATVRIAPKISGRIARILVDLSDPVERGAEVAIMDDDEFKQAVTSARADLTVARAQASEASNRLELTQRELERTITLEERGVTSAATLDAIQSEFTMRQSAAKVAAANLEARMAALATAEIRLGYTRVNANWTEGDATRVVAERFLDEGDTVAANTPLVSVVSIRPIRSAFYVPERDYALLQRGQVVELRTDAFPDDVFKGVVTRIAPVFRQESRQARVEVLSDNADERLKPGMFVRATVVLQTIADARSVPVEALARRGGETGVFVVDQEEKMARWSPVETGIESEGYIQIVQPELEGWVVTLGQQLIADGVPIRVVGEP